MNITLKIQDEAETSDFERINWGFVFVRKLSDERDQFDLGLFESGPANRFSFSFFIYLGDTKFRFWWFRERGHNLEVILRKF